MSRKEDEGEWRDIKREPREAQDIRRNLPRRYVNPPSPSYLGTDRSFRTAKEEILRQVREHEFEADGLALKFEWDGIELEVASDGPSLIVDEASLHSPTSCEPHRKLAIQFPIPQMSKQDDDLAGKWPGDETEGELESALSEDISDIPRDAYDPYYARFQRYMVFHYGDHYRRGGLRDCEQSFDDLVEACVKLREARRGNSYVQLFDRVVGAEISEKYALKIAEEADRD